MDLDPELRMKEGSFTGEPSPVFTGGLGYE